MNSCDYAQKKQRIVGVLGSKTDVKERSNVHFVKKRLIFFMVIVSLIINILPVLAFTEQEDDIVILYENDVHCEIGGYSAISALRNELKQEHEYVGIVSSGDFLQGGSLGSISRGEYIARLMNAVGYDAIALGNHEFDYGIERLNEIVDMLDTKPVCANFKKIGEGEYFEPYSIVSYGDVKIAYIGITTTATTEESSLPTQFVDENKNPIYTFSKDNLADVVQENIDKARNEGADFVIALSHLGDEGSKHDAAGVVANTVGLDVVLDAHSHSVIESETLLDKNGNEVVYTSTGTKFANIGKLTISADNITTELISLEEYTATDPVVDACIDQIMAEYAEVGNKKIGECEFDLITHDSDGNRIIRVSETNLGDFVADAFRSVLDADISYFNGGGIRSHMESGEITFNDLVSILPFNNTGVVAEISGQKVLEMLEVAVAGWPKEDGAFPHVSGITFSVNTLAEAKNRVYNVKVANPETGIYETLDPDKMYTVASANFIILECGNGMTMFEGAKVTGNTGILDVEILEKYLVDHLGGVIGEKYAEVDNRIAFTDGEVTDNSNDSQGNETDKSDTAAGDSTNNSNAPEKDYTVLIVVLAGALVAVATATVLIIRRKRK